MKTQTLVANRLLYDREKIKEHELHISRLRNVKSVLNNSAPKQHNHLSNGKQPKTKQLMVKYMEMQNENRILLKKMLQIDLKPSQLNPSQILFKPSPSTSSLNRVSRLRELVKVNEENKILLKRLQNAHSTYDKTKWDKEFDMNSYFNEMIRRNSSRYCKHPYFIQTPSTCNLFGGSQYTQGDMYGSMHSGRVMSANPLNGGRMSTWGKFQGESSPGKEGSTATTQQRTNEYNRKYPKMSIVQSEKSLRPFTAPSQDHQVYRKKNRKILSGRNTNNQNERPATSGVIQQTDILQQEGVRIQENSNQETELPEGTQQNQVTEVENEEAKE